MVVLLLVVIHALRAHAACVGGEVRYVDRESTRFIERWTTRTESCLRTPPPDAPALIGDPAIDRARREAHLVELERWAATSWAQCRVPR